MRLGICTRYTNHEATYAAIRLAEAAESLDVEEVSLFTMTPQLSRISPRWDDKVVRVQHVPFSRWAAKQDHILWTTVPHKEQLCWVRQQQKKTTILVLWHELDSQAMSTLATADSLLCPSVACYDFMRNRYCANAVCLPWDCGQPLFSKPDNYSVTRPKIFLPFWDGNARRSEMTAIRLLDILLRRHVDLEITLACNSSTISSAATRTLGRIPKTCRQRLHIVRGTPPSTRFQLFQSHDLTLYPSHFESTGMTVVQSLEMGTPVVAFNFRPLTEILTTSNSVTVACKEETNSVGTPRAVPDYDGLSDTLYHLLNDIEFLSELQDTTLAGVEHRRDAFVNTLRSVVL